MSWIFDSPDSAPTNDDGDVATFNGVLLAWRQANVPFARASDTITLQMRRSRCLFGFPTLAEWFVRAPRRPGLPFVDWSRVDLDEALTLGMRMLGEASVPPHVFVAWEEQARLAMRVDEEKRAYQRYLDDLSGWNPTSAARPPRLDAPRTPLNAAALRAKAAMVRRAFAFDPAPPVTVALPDDLAKAALAFEVLGDADDAVRLEMASALTVDESRALLALAMPVAPALDAWLATPAAARSTEHSATITATRLGLEHLAVRLAMLDAGPEALDLLERAPTDPRVAVAVERARSGVWIWSSDARATSDRIDPCRDDFVPMVSDVFDVDTANALLLFKAEKGLGHARFADDAVPTMFAPLLRYAELLDVGGDVATHIAASNGITPRSQARLVALVEPLLPALVEWLWSFAVRGTPLSRCASAMFALTNVVNHLRAPFEKRMRIE
jgi:hypothetical protein